MEEKATRRSRAAAIAAAGALAILLASTLVRCGAADVPAGTDDGGTPAAAEQAQQPASEGTGGSRQDEGASLLEAASATSWVAGDGSGSTLQVADRSMIEKAADGTVSALSWSSATESESGGQALVTLALEDGTSASIVVDLEDGAPAAMSSDSFAAAGRYVAGGAGAGGFEVSGVDERYLELVGGDAEGLADAIGSHAARRSPQASGASFDGEVYLDLGTGLVSATFHLNDNASTVVTVQWLDGSFEVL